MTTIHEIHRKINEAYDTVSIFDPAIYKEDLTLVLGKKQMNDLKGTTLPFNIIEANMDSVFEICWVIPREIQY